VEDGEGGGGRAEWGEWGYGTVTGDDGGAIGFVGGYDEAGSWRSGGHDEDLGGLVFVVGSRVLRDVMRQIVEVVKSRE